MLLRSSATKARWDSGLPTPDHSGTHRTEEPICVRLGSHMKTSRKRPVSIPRNRFDLGISWAFFQAAALLPHLAESAIVA